MPKRNFVIPVFIPQLGCPFECVYCNQRKIAGRNDVPTEETIVKIIENHLSTIPRDGSRIEVGFFGGNFTGLARNHQEKFLNIAFSYLEMGAAHGIRISTRPDYIDEASLSLLKEYRVDTVELGAQSCDDEVLWLAGRSHTSEQIVKASRLVVQYGMRLGLQMMIGLPGDTLNKSLGTAKRIVELGAAITRIYPTLVIRGTGLEKLYRLGEYTPLDLDDAVCWTREIMKIFEKGGVRVIRAGLHPSEGLLNRKDLVAGPFHQSYKELVLTEIWREILENAVKGKKGERMTLHVSPEEMRYAIGYSGTNREFLKRFFHRVDIIADKTLCGRQFIADFN
jgi:histone acetyltransferase (RNA polymerase elongator complex component)